jgi:hypothetical protein
MAHFLPQNGSTTTPVRRNWIRGMQEICFPLYGSEPPAIGQTIPLRGHNTTERGKLSRARFDVHIARNWQSIETVQHSWRPPVHAWSDRQSRLVNLQVPVVMFGTLHRNEYQEALEVLMDEMAAGNIGYLRSQVFLFTYVSPHRCRLSAADFGY